MSHKALHEPCCCWISCSRSAYYVYRCCTESKAVEWCLCSVLAFRVVGAVAYYGLVSIWHRGYTIPSPNENNQVVDQRSARLTSDMPGNAVRVGDQMRIAWAVNISSFSRHTSGKLGQQRWSDEATVCRPVHESQCATAAHNNPSGYSQDVVAEGSLPGSRKFLLADAKLRPCLKGAITVLVLQR